MDAVNLDTQKVTEEEKYDPKIDYSSKIVEILQAYFKNKTVELPQQ